MAAGQCQAFAPYYWGTFEIIQESRKSAVEPSFGDFRPNYAHHPSQHKLLHTTVCRTHFSEGRLPHLTMNPPGGSVCMGMSGVGSPLAIPCSQIVQGKRSGGTAYRLTSCTACRSSYTRIHQWVHGVLWDTDRFMMSDFQSRLIVWQTLPRIPWKTKLY